MSARAADNAAHVLPRSRRAPPLLQTEQPRAEPLNDAAFAPLIYSRVAPPRVSGAVVKRNGIMSMLAEPAPLTLIVGPAGCGKTVVCTSWRKQLMAMGYAVAWLQLVPDEDDTPFVAYVSAAFETVGLTLPTRPTDMGIRTGAASSMRQFLAELINGLHRDQRPMVLVLEDFHWIRSSAILDFMTRLLEWAPANLHVAISSRTRPPLNLLPFRAHDRITEIGFPELRFSWDETKQLMCRQRIEDTNAHQLRAVHELTEGWAAGLQLTAIGLRKAPDKHHFVQCLERGHASAHEHDLREHFKSCVIEHIHREELDLLAGVAICRRFSPALCEHLTGQSEALRVLSRLEADAFFVLPLETDHGLPWYRFHRLLAADLNERLRAMPAAEVVAMHQRASDWFAAHGLHAEAIHHAREAQNEDRHLELIERAARPTLERAGFSQLLEWFEQVPPDRARQCMSLLRCVAWAQVLAGALDDFEATMAVLVAHPDAKQADVAMEIKLLKAFRLLRMDDTNAVLRCLSSHGRPTTPLRPFHQMLLRGLWAYAWIGDDRFEQARDWVRERAHMKCVQSVPQPMPILDAALGIGFLAQGEMQQARQALAVTMADARTLGADSSAFVACYLAEAHYQVDELKEAQTLLDEFATHALRVGTSDSLIHLHRVRARLCVARGEPDAAMAVLSQMDLLAGQHGLDRMAAHALSLRVQFEVKRRQWSSAREALRRMEALAQRHKKNDQGALADIGRLLDQARSELALAMGQFQQAQHLLKPLIDDSARRGRLEESTRLRLLFAIAQEQQGQRESALETVRQALMVAHERGMWRSFIDAGETIALLLQACVQSHPLPADEATFASNVLRRQPVKNPLDPAPMRGERALDQVEHKWAQRPPEQLSLRETEILDLLAQALSTKSIARVLNVSVGTVKWHLKNIYVKLDVGSREQAVLKARGMRRIA